MGRQINGCLHDWGIARVLAVTVDNASANGTCIKYLRGRLTSRGCDVSRGEYLLMRCTTHVVNLIVQDGLQVINPSIVRVREAIKFVRGSPSRLARFRECCRDENIESKSLLCLDVTTRWNSTYLMLSVALKFEKALEHLDVKDPYFRLDLSDGVPTNADWDVVRNMIDILVVFYELTLRVSASFHVTSNMVYHAIDSIGNLLKEWVHCENKEIRAMSMQMQLKYEKY